MWQINTKTQIKTNQIQDTKGAFLIKIYALPKIIILLKFKIQR
jgi:hypothetical protein